MSFLRSTEPESIRADSEGLCFLYVLPCPGEDMVKLGFSRDPLVRMETLHTRWFDFFDIDRGCLVQTDTVREARRLELDLSHEMAQHNAPQPLLIHDPAGGASEWYRGAHAALLQAADGLARAGFTVHRPLRPWLRSRMLKRREDLFEWAQAVLLAVEGDASNLERGSYRPLRARVLAVLDAYPALRIPLAPWLPDALMDWYRQAYRSTHSYPLPGEEDDAAGQTA